MVAYASAGSQYDQYKRQSAMTASPGELTLMLYDGAIKNLKLFKMYNASKDFIKANEVSQKTQAIIAELMRSLDMRYEVSQQLLRLYDYILSDVVQSNIKKDDAPADTAMDMLTDLRDTWQQATRLNRQQTLGSTI